MKLDMEIEEIEVVLERIWDLHDKLSDAIHSISRAHFLCSIKSLRKSEKKKLFCDVNGEENRNGFVFVKDLRPDDSDAAIQEAKSLNAIRTALENLEDQLEFFHTIQTQQRAERDAAIARLEQSRLILAMRLSEHHGKKYKVLEEALAFVGDVHEAARFISPDNLYSSPVSPSGQNVTPSGQKGPNILIKVFISSFNFVKRAMSLSHMGGMLSNAALFTVSMIAMIHLQRVSRRPLMQEDCMNGKRTWGRNSQLVQPSSSGQFSHLDVLLARG